MKYNILKITFLLLVAIFNATIGFGSLPLWAYVLIEFVSIILLVYVSVKMFSDNNTVINQEIKKLTETISAISEKSKAQLENNTSKLLDSLSTNQEQVLQKLTHSEETMNKNIENSTSQINETLSHTYDLVQKEFTKQIGLVGALQQNTTELFNGLSKDIISWNESSRKQVIENTNELKRTLASNTEHLSTVVNNSLKTIQESTFSSSDQLKQQIAQICDAIQESINTSVSDLAAKSDALNETLKTTNDEIQAKVESASNGMSQLIMEGIGAITTSVSTGIDGARQASSESAEQIMSANKENSASILQKVDELIVQGATIEKQNNTISSLIVDSVKESDKATEMFMSGLQDQYQTINKGLTSVQLKAENIENSILHISEKEFNKKIVDSIQSLILELRTDIRNSISDINNEFLDTQIAQEVTNSELEKLQVLLRTVLSSFENKTEKIVKQVATESNKQAKLSSSTPSILPNVSRSVEQNVKTHQPDPNRTESIVDSETKNIVVNQYKDGIVVKSTMKDSKGHTIYEVEYSKGKIVRTRNYDSKSKLTIEQTFYDNGQVHYRNEYTSKGKVTTEFDINGKKK